MTWTKSTKCEGASCVEVDFKKSTKCEQGACAEVGFVRSSFCDAGVCAEVHFDEDMIAIRNNQAPADVIHFDPDEWRAFILGVKAGEFDFDLL